MSSYISNTSTNTRPELSNLTMEYLMQNSSGSNKEEENK